MSLELPVRSWRAELPGPARSQPLDVTLPRHFDDFLPRSRSRYVLSASVDVPEGMRDQPLTLVIAHMPAMASLEVNGAEAVALEAGLVDSVRASTPHRWRVPREATKNGRLELELTIENTMARSAWIDSVPTLTTAPNGGAWVADVHAFNTVAATGALAAALIVAALYSVLFVSLRDRRRAAYGWFALGATSGAAYPAFLLGLTQPLFGVYEAPAITFSLVVGSLAAMHFSRAYVDEAPPSRVWWWVLLLIGVTAAVFRDPFWSVLVMTPIVVAITIATAVAQVRFVVGLRRRKNSPGGLYGIAFAFPGAVLLGLPDVIAWLGQGEWIGGIRTACLGIAVIAVYQATALSRAHLVSLARADSLVAELGDRVRLQEEKNREVELLNDELRRQIAARSRELAEKLSRVVDDAVAPPNLDAGTIVEERYRVVQTLGAGGMGAVYEVERIADGKHFALKALSSNHDPHARARFAREAQIVANVNHPNVVSIVDVDVAKSGWVFLVMELVTGGTTLHDIRLKPRAVAWTLAVLADVAEGLDAVHAAGIVHRDLKPSNVLLSLTESRLTPSVKITDFGISSLQPDDTTPSSARMPTAHDALPLAGAPSTPPPMMDLEPDASITSTDRDRTQQEGAVQRAKKAPRTPSAPLTQTGLIFGTPQYMAQELSAGMRNATRSSDVFSLGIIAFELLTGKRPFVEAPVTAKLDGHPLPPIPDFKRYCPTLPVFISELLGRAMSHDPKARPLAKELASALHDAAAQVGTRA